MTTASADDARTRVLGLLRRYGHDATSFQVLEHGFRYWFDGDAACVAYVDTGRAWVAAGAPLAPDEALAVVTARFISAARACGRRACFFAAEARLVHAAGGALGALHVGEQPVWDPAAWEGTLGATRSLREQLRRARARGVVVRAVPAAEIAAPTGDVRRAVDALVARWLSSRAMAPMGFLVDVQPFVFPDERRYFVAECAGSVVGVLVAVPVYARGGWFFEDLLRDPAAPNGTAEALFDAAMRAAGAEGSRHVTLGLAPLAGDVSGWLRRARRWSRALYDFRGVQAFKTKLRPGAWEPVYLAHPAGASGTHALLDALAAFARGSFARFGLQTVLRGPALVVRALAVALVPWMAALAAADTRRWFPAAWVKFAWLGFDAALVVALLALAARWRRPLATALAAAVTADATLTALQAAVYNAPRADRAVDAVVLAIACAAPAAAATILWSALRRRA